MTESIVEQKKIEMNDGLDGGYDISCICQYCNDTIEMIKDPLSNVLAITHAIPTPIAIAETVDLETFIR